MPADHELVGPGIFFQLPFMQLIRKQHVQLVMPHFVIDKIYGMNTASFFKQKKNKKIMFMRFLNTTPALYLVVYKAVISFKFDLEIPDPENRKYIFCFHGGKIQK